MFDFGSARSPIGVFVAVLANRFRAVPCDPDREGMVGTKYVAVALGVLGLSSTVALPARAQTPGFAIDRFDPAERGSDWLVLESLDLRGHERPAVGLVAEYAYRPLVVYNADGSLRSSVVRDSLVLHPGASIVLWERLRAGLDLPVYAFQDGHTGRLSGTTYPPPSENIGDIRVGAKSCAPAASVNGSP
jgi:hypothetical protein